MKTLPLCLSIFAASAAFTLASASAKASGTPLFTLERNTNINQLIYEMTPDNLIHPYWNMLASRPPHTEELTYLERTQAYGVLILSQPPEPYQFTVRALPAYPVTVWTSTTTGHPYGTLRIQGTALILKRIYLHLTGLFKRDVSSIDIECQAGESGPLQYYNLTQAGGGKYKETGISCTASAWQSDCN